MDSGLVPPCLELGATAEHGVLAWMSRKARRKDAVVPYEYGRLIDQASRGVFGTGHRTRPIEQAIHHLFDGDYIKKVDFGASFGFEVLVRCPCGEEGKLRIPPAARSAVGGAIVMRSAHGDGDDLTGVDVSVISSLSTGSLPGPTKKSAGTTVALARDFFPQVVPRENGYYSNSNWPALARHLNQWKAGGTSLDIIRLMMEEFGCHPEWCSRSTRPPWRVFIGRRDDLEALVAARQRRDPSNRTFGPKTKDEWFSRRTFHAQSLA